MAPSSPAPVPDRQRLTLDLSPDVALLLDHINTLTGVPKSQIVGQALLDALPALFDQAEACQKRASQVRQAMKGKR